jgi:hypothetical protein
MSQDEIVRTRPALIGIVNEERIRREKEDDAYFASMAGAFRYQAIVDLYRRVSQRSAAKGRLTVIPGGAGAPTASQKGERVAPGEDESHA